MRKNWKNNLLLSLVFLLLLVLNGCKENHNHEAGTNGEVIYTCPMHPQIVRSEPGSCPICGMNLVPKQTSAAPAAAIPTDLNYLLEPVNQTVISSVTTIQPIQKRVQNEIVMSGIVTYDTRRQYTIPARFGGRIEKVYVQFNYQPVR
ncbi:MAG: hypothetical protein JWQ14_339, partial [Adhaeribacter sp.]|nr:hypothetical protein [Adhaeribacter sp.]